MSCPAASEFSALASKLAADAYELFRSPAASEFSALASNLAAAPTSSPAASEIDPRLRARPPPGSAARLLLPGP